MAPGPIFSSKSVQGHFAFHSGGRDELQFNIGTDDGGMRHGVAFSLEPSQSFPSIDPLVPKIARFNEYVRSNGRKFDGYEMWVWKNDGSRSENTTVRPILPEWVHVGNFIFIGKTQPVDAINIGRILGDFDHLLELYLFVEDAADASEVDALLEAKEQTPEWRFQAGHTPYAHLHSATFAERTLDVDLRHNWLQTRIFSTLCEMYGEDCVGTEQGSISKGEIDFVIEKGEWRVFAELKTSARALTCIRESLGQLLEYAYFGMKSPPAELWVIGTGGCSGKERHYLQELRMHLGIKLYYRQFDEEQGILGNPI